MVIDMVDDDGVFVCTYDDANDSLKVRYMEPGKKSKVVSISVYTRKIAWMHGLCVLDDGVLFRIVEDRYRPIQKNKKATQPIYFVMNFCPSPRM